MDFYILSLLIHEHVIPIYLGLLSSLQFPFINFLETFCISFLRISPSFFVLHCFGKKGCFFNWLLLACSNTINFCIQQQF